MKARLPRPLAASLLFGALLALAGLVTASAWADLSDAQDERDAKAEYVARGVRTVATGPGAPAAAPDLFVRGDSETLAAAALDAEVRTICGQAGASVFSTRAEAKHDDGPIAGRIEVQAVIEAGNDALQSILVRLESGAPAMMVDAAAIRPAATAGSDAPPAEGMRLHAELTLSGYWRAPEK